MVTAPAPALSDSHALPQAAVGAASNSSESSNSFQTVYQSLPAFVSDSQNVSNLKISSPKKLSPKDAQDNLAAIVHTGTVEPPSARPLPSLPSFSLTGREAGASGQTANEVAQLAPGIQTAVGANAFSAERTGVQLAEQATSVHREAAANSQTPFSAPSFSLGVPTLPAVPEIARGDSGEQANGQRSSRTSTSAASEPAIDPALFTKGLAATIAPRPSNLAFSLKMAESNSTARHAQLGTQSDPADKTGTAAQPKGQERTANIATSVSVPRTTVAPASATTAEVATVASTVNPVWNAASAAPQTEIAQDTQFTEAREPATLSSVAAVHEAQQILPEAPRPAAAAEIMLQLGGKDQAAAIRVTDRAGTVNVSVHATDADLRTSLRSNLGDLASQLSHQGWKTEVVKTGAVLARTETSQDPQQNGQRSPNQQQPSSQGDRQPQRDRRSNSGQWLAEFEEQASGNSGGTK